MHFDWEQLTDGVHRCRLPFLDVTVGLVQGSAAALLIDTGTTLAESQAIAEDVRAITGCNVKHVVLTHKHFDHVLGSGTFRDAEIYCAPEVVNYLTTSSRELRDDALRHGTDAEGIDRALAALRPPQHSVDDAVVDLGERQVTIASLGSGHTGADLVVVVPGDPTVVFTGDLVEESGDPAIDSDSDVAAWPHTLDRLLEVGGSAAMYVPGHGSVVDAKFVRRQRDWLREFRMR